ncbi:lipopolysaccharide biosynthesis protein [Propionibacteriaceae bacterium G57]|uniref:lipopolysaccharide biosynthesis protein n=1 Tax=Aestuariimicrobium sp. G57 TaxID=3418485 RepID=UPI003DA74D1C
MRLRICGAGRLGSLLASAGTFAVAISQWYLVWLFARAVGGAEAVGEYSALLAIATPVFVVGQWGLRTLYLTLQRRVPWGVYLAMRLAGAGLAAVTVLAIVAFMASGRASLEVGIWLVILKVANALADLLYGRIQRGGELGLLGLVTLGNAAATCVLATVAVVATGSMAAGVAASALASAIACAAAWWWGRRVDGQAQARSATPAGVDWMYLLRQGLPVTMSQGLAALGTYLPVLLLSLVAGRQTVGVFTTASYLLTAVNLLGAALQTIQVTHFRTLTQADGVLALAARTARLSKWSVLLGAAGVLVVVACGSWVLGLVFGHEFRVGRWELLVLAIGAVAVVPSYVFSTALSVLNRYREQSRAYAVAIVGSAGVGGALLALGVPPLMSAFAMTGALNAIRLGAMVGFFRSRCRAESSQPVSA